MQNLNKYLSIVMIALSLISSSASAAEVKETSGFTSWFKNFLVVHSGPVTGPPRSGI